MTVLGYDATHDNVSAIPVNARFVFVYATGTLRIRWTPADVARFPHARKAVIDQGFGAVFLKSANVMDVERGAYSPADISRWMHDNTTDGPAVYCNQSTLPAVLDTGYRGNLWLAKLTTQPPVIPVIVPGCTVIAQQFDFETAFDVSAVFQDGWPNHGGTMPEIQFDAPHDLKRTVPIYVEWAQVPAVNGIPPTSYTVEVVEMNGVVFDTFTTTELYAEIPNVPAGWTVKVRVWANGGGIAPPGAEIEVHV